MKALVQFMLVFMMLVLATTVFSAEATQMWKCEMDDDASEEDVIALAQEWLKSAKKNGGW